MRGTLANYKENLNKIALDVHYDDDGEELKIYDSRNVDDMSVSDRRDSHSFANSKSVSWSPVSNGFESPHDPEIERYKAEIKRLQESEAEIKALSVNYAALLKEKEEQISRLNGEYGLLKQNLDATNAALNAFRNGNSKASSNGINIPKGSGDLSPSRQHKLTAQVKNRHAGHQLQNGFSKQDGVSNGSHALQTEVVQSSKMQGKEKELADLLEEKNRSLAAERAAYESQTRQLRMELEQQRNKFADVQLKLQEEQRLNESFQDELKSLKMDKDKTSIEITEMRKELNGKLSELRRLQMELNRREDGDANDVVENLKRVVATLEKENNSLKMEKTELVAALEKNRKSSNEKIFPDASEYPSRLDGKMVSSESFPGKEEMEQSLQKLEKDLKETCSERDKALQELTRLKQHLIEKAQEESEKMDEDSKIIEELRENNEYQRAQILHLENVLKQTLAKQEEFKMMNHSEIQKSKEIIDGLNNKLANCMRTIEAKNVELLNLQTALGQYFAEIEAKGHLERELALAREESAKLSEYLKNADQRAEVSRSEKEEILVKLSHSEKMLAEGKGRANKLEEDNAKLRLAVEQSMTRLNRMSVDSDFLVDRRIVIKLLVTYFQRNHSKEVLDLMVRMLGFSDEDKQRIGMAQQGAGKGVVRGVLGLPGRLVGGIIGGSQADANAKMASENQIYGLTFFLRKLKKERGENLLKIWPDPRKIYMEEVELLQRLAPLQSLGFQDRIYLLAKILIPCPLKEIFGSWNILIQSSQQFLSHHQRAILASQDYSRITENV
ncbi:hypothetical protein CISIN_1g003941mg [Citrus sinensis]|uniref:GRIP domain-containing protein n=1 Tax=Citrus sinensis TaxID=2711 RepID=A0A067H2V5_CITSI|nr:hypothetical protein CISIN_1g003941mg [Citrus sinensis]